MPEQQKPMSYINSVLIEDGYGTLNFFAGEISIIYRSAAKLAVTYELPMKFTFNNVQYDVTLEEAKNLLTKENIETYIDGCRGAIRNLERNILHQEELIAEEIKIGIKLFGEVEIKVSKPARAT